MKLIITPAARAYISHRGNTVTVESFVVAGCCTPDLPPEVKVGSPHFPDGFEKLQADNIVVYFDSLLTRPAELVMDTNEYAKREELVIRNWPAPSYAH